MPLESPRGYLCRVAHAHAYAGPRWLAALAGISCGGLLEREDRARQLAHVLRLEIPEWLQMCYRPVKTKGRRSRRSFLGQHIEPYQLNYRCPRVCPCCLREASIWWAVWDLAVVSACPVHCCLLIGQCPACGRALTWHRPAVHQCRCGADLRKGTPIAADSGLVMISAALYRAAGFHPHACGAELKRANVPRILGNLTLDPLLVLIRFVGSIQEEGKLRRKQIKFALTDIDAAIKVGSAAASILMDWPRSFREMLRRMAPGQTQNTADLSFRNSDVFGNFYRHLYEVLPRKEFGFLHDTFEEFVAQDWKGLIRGQHRFFSSLTRRSSQWITLSEAKTNAHMNPERMTALVRNGYLEGIFVKMGRRHTECWIRRESLNGWCAKHKEEMARYLSRPLAMQALGLAHSTVLKVAQAGLIRYISGSEKSFPASGIYFLKEDVLRLKHAFEKHSVRVQPYSKPGKLIALRHGLKNYLGRDSGLPAAIRAVVDGKLHPVGYTKRFPGITGYLFLSDELRRYRPVQTETPPEDLLSYNEAAKVLGIKRTVIRALVIHGIFSAPHSYRFGLSKLVPAGEVRRFAKEYVDAAILSQRSRETIYWVKRHLRESAVPILEISIHQNFRKVFVPKEIAEKVKIPRRHPRPKPITTSI